MLPIKLTLEVESVERAVDAFELAINQQVAAGLLRFAGVVADDAIAGHAFANRTGLLESQIRPGAIAGTFMNGDLEALVLGDTVYGEFVEERPQFAFLGPAFERTEQRGDAILQESLAVAARLAGW